MNTLIIMLVAAIPRAVLAIAGKLLSDSLIQGVLEKVLVAGLEKAAKLSTNTVDDEIVADIAARLKGNK